MYAKAVVCLVLSAAAASAADPPARLAFGAPTPLALDDALPPPRETPGPPLPPLGEGLLPPLGLAPPAPRPLTEGPSAVFPLPLPLPPGPPSPTYPPPQTLLPPQPYPPPQTFPPPLDRTRSPPPPVRPTLKMLPPTPRPGVTLPQPGAAGRPAATMLPPRPIPPNLKLAPLPTPPDVGSLHQELDALHAAVERMQKERSTLPSPDAAPPGPGSDESLHLRLQVGAMINRLRQARSAPPPPVPHEKVAPAAPPPRRPAPPPQAAPVKPRTVPEGPIDAAALGRAQFLANNFKAALEAFRSLEPTEQSAEDRLVTQYMMASCLRRLDRFEEAAGLYREVANARGPEALVKGAQWHLQAMKARQELTAELERLKARRLSLLGGKP